MCIGNAVLFQGSRQHVLAKLRISPGLRNGAYIHHFLHSMGLEQRQKLFNKRAKESPAFKHGEELAQIFTEFILDISCELW
ncbi:MAG: hypothetical protein AUH89_01350 [Ktedonobacter sp. 13_1_40CM_4_52_4]|nr:MAG: hypothetical protein AUH89_01350 [Ktedonobacter sp. 13_1_40CM_4_52_4]